MSSVRIALANLRFPASPDESTALAARAVERAAGEGASVVCFPECFVPGYRAPAKGVPAVDSAWLERAWGTVAAAARRGRITVVLGTERLDGEMPVATALVVAADGTLAGFQDKVQIDPSEEGVYAAGSGRRVFGAGTLTFGIVICHEGWRYPETVRWAARHGAQVVFHPQFHGAEQGSHRPRSFAETAGTFHEKAALCRAAENACWFATVNYASEGSPTTSAFVRPDGTVLRWQPYGEEGLLVADLDLADATGWLAARHRPSAEDGSGEETLVFVYGTLLRGEANAGLLPRAELVGAVRTAAGFELLDMGSHPGMVRFGSGSVVGELYRVDAGTLRELDRFEEHPRFFRREVVRLDDGRVVQAYLPARPDLALPRVRDGNWRAARGR